MRPDSTPTDPRLFPTERNELAEIDARALDLIAREMGRFSPSRWPSAEAVQFADAVRAAILPTGRLADFRRPAERKHDGFTFTPV